MWQGKRDARVARAFKRVAKKVNPVDTDQTDVSIPGGVLDWKAKALKREEGLPRNSKFPDYKAVLAWDFTEIEKVSKNVNLPVKINATPHKA